MQSSNPVLNENTFGNLSATYAHDDQGMTAQGAANKTIMLLGMALMTAAWAWHVFATGGVQAVTPWLIGGVFGGLVFALVTCFKMQWAPVTAPFYALCEGLALGGISAAIEANAKIGYHGIVIQAVGLTFGTALCMLLAYKLGLIRATEKFKLGVIAATGAIALVYLVSMILGFFGMAVPYLHDAGPIGIGISLVIVVVAALNLILDFDFVETAAARGAPKWVEWYAAFGLMVTLVWLYMEFLRLLSKLNRRN